jgi:hypothetical protein
MMIHSTCAQCGQDFTLTDFRQRVCGSCPPDYLAQLEAAFIAAVLAGQTQTADALALTLDTAAESAYGLLDAATAYARDGWPVFPCLPGDKRPATRHGFQDATTDLGRVTRWWQRHPDHNIGSPTGHAFDVIDIDYSDKPDALEWWLKVREQPDFDIDGIATTPRGLHIYVVPTGAGNSSKLFGIAGIDYRGIGGYVVLPPSVRTDGRYQWMTVVSPRIKGM